LGPRADQVLPCGSDVLGVDRSANGVQLLLDPLVRQESTRLLDQLLDDPNAPFQTALAKGHTICIRQPVHAIR
jgi:hypothetical protein